MSQDKALKKEIITALEQYNDPLTGESLLKCDLIEHIHIDEGNVAIRILQTTGRSREERFAFEDVIHEAIKSVDGVNDLLIDVVSPPAESAESSTKETVAPSTDNTPSSQPPPPQPPASNIPAAKAIEGVGRVIAVASGKGGVGKSTVACNLAMSLSAMGHAVGLLDVDIYGPSLPILLGIDERPKVLKKRIQPIEVQGLKVMSIGFLMEEDSPVIWRGPIVTGIIRQFLQDVNWSGLDYLIVDLPPGTGDAQLTLAQSVPLDGAVVVTTPSDLALIDAARGLQMFRTLNIEVLGIVENMSYYIWPGQEQLQQIINETAKIDGTEKSVEQLQQCLEKHGKIHIFGKGGGHKEAERLGIRLLGQIPLDAELRALGDRGQPIVAAHPDSETAQAFIKIATQVASLKPVDNKTKTSKGGVLSFLKR
jgi:ATP-binding protein involved in chromosome partitioning